MKVLTELERQNLAAYLLPWVNGDRELYQPKRASMYHTPKPWHAGSKASQELKEIKISELMSLSDADLLELQNKIEHAKLQKSVKTRQSRYFLK